MQHISSIDQFSKDDRHFRKTRTVRYSRFHLVLIFAITFAAVISAGFATMQSAQAAAPEKMQSTFIEIRKTVIQIPAQPGRKVAGQLSGYVSEVGPAPLPDYSVSSIVSMSKMTNRSVALVAMIALLLSMATITFEMWRRTASDWSRRTTGAKLRFSAIAH